METYPWYIVTAYIVLGLLAPRSGLRSAILSCDEASMSLPWRMWLQILHRQQQCPDAIRFG